MARPMSLSDSPRFHRSQIAALSLTVIRDRRTRCMIPPIISSRCVDALNPPRPRGEITISREGQNWAGVQDRQTNPTSDAARMSRFRRIRRAPWSTLPRMRIAAGIALLAAVTLGALHGAAPAPIACESLAQTECDERSRAVGRVHASRRLHASEHDQRECRRGVQDAPGVLSRDADS